MHRLHSSSSHRHRRLWAEAVLRRVKDPHYRMWRRQSLAYENARAVSQSVVRKVQAQEARRRRGEHPGKIRSPRLAIVVFIRAYTARVPPDVQRDDAALQMAPSVGGKGAVRELADWRQVVYPIRRDVERLQAAVPDDCLSLGRGARHQSARRRGERRRPGTLRRRTPLRPLRRRRRRLRLASCEKCVCNLFRAFVATAAASER
mmetsp:Transcript_13305/g.44458  ORF Transcript_13305/g.44458 Transcript_13305/m.44458 type:complete len:204 (-) Transcript_13305:340-951(-)